jgi:ATP/maltotriose-dependent transcriptional regulator MalT
MAKPATRRRASRRDTAGRSRALELGRQSLRTRAWGAAFRHLSAADSAQPLQAVDLEALAASAHLIGKEAECAELLARAHRCFLAEESPRRAAQCAYRLGFSCLFNGELAQAAGWFARAERLLEDQGDCVEKGYLFLPAGYRQVQTGEAVQAYATFERAATIGERFGDHDLTTLARQGQGRALIRQGQIARGVSLLDEAMVAVRAGDVTPIIAGNVYCSVLEACSEIFDLRRAREWTAALDEWCASQPDIVPYRNHCLVRRAEVLQLQGAWSEALREAKQACERLSQPAPKPALGTALYRLAELHRLRGEFAEAEEAYRQASKWQRLPHPGLAQLRLGQGQIESANEAIRHVADEVKELGARAIVMDAYVEIALAAKDPAAARAAADELAKIATKLNAPIVGASADRAQGAVLLAEGDARAALTILRRALGVWRDLDAPYEAARVRVLIALACREVGNCDAAEIELRSAREIFEGLGAGPDLARLKLLVSTDIAGANSPLTARETEVLKLVAAGSTNRKIAGTLKISEKTVARHLSNIFNKLDLSSRSGATAYAYEHGVV